jgi:hypothetical protein
MVDMGNHGRDFAFLGTEKILADPLFEVLGFADVDDLVIGVLHQIAARLIR